MINPLVSRLIDLALEEDIANGDITTKACVAEDKLGFAKLIAKQELVLCGVDVFKEVFLRVDRNIEFDFKNKDGEFIQNQTAVAQVTGKVASLLTAERTALNFVQRLSGVATKTKALIQLVDNASVKIVDTRKTTPGWRVLEKYAVKVGGGQNHRQGLFDAVLIKNNHIDVNDGNIEKCFQLAKSKNKPGTFIQIEIRNLVELEQVLKLDVDSVLLDNLSPEKTLDFVKIIRKTKPKLIIESSGGINENNIKSYSQTGIDRISLGALTHSAIAVDLSLKISLS